MPGVPIIMQQVSCLWVPGRFNLSQVHVELHSTDWPCNLPAHPAEIASGKLQLRPIYKTQKKDRGMQALAVENQISRSGSGKSDKQVWIKRGAVGSVLRLL